MDKINEENIADWLDRLYAIIIDLIALWILGLILPINLIYYDLLPEGYVSQSWEVATNVEAFLLSPIYFIGFRVWQNGQTLGKRVLNLQTIKLDGSRLTIFDSFLDCLGYIIWPIDFFLGIFISNNSTQRFTQVLARTGVIYK